MPIVLYTKGEDGQLVQSKEWASWTDMALDNDWEIIIKKTDNGVVGNIDDGQTPPMTRVMGQSMVDVIYLLERFFERYYNVHDDCYVVGDSQGS